MALGAYTHTHTHTRIHTHIHLHIESDFKKLGARRPGGLWPPSTVMLIALQISIRLLLECIEVVEGLILTLQATLAFKALASSVSHYSRMPGKVFINQKVNYIIHSHIVT